jgi:excisionase family DNA binding protein
MAGRGKTMQLGKITYSRKTLTVPEAAEIVGISKSKMYEVVKMKGFPTIQIGTRILVSAKGLECWLDEMAEKGWQGPEGNF